MLKGRTFRPTAAVTAVKFEPPCRSQETDAFVRRLIAGLQLLGLVEESVRCLDRPLGPRTEPEAGGPGIGRARIQVVAILVRLAASKPGALERQRPSIDADHQHAGRDVRRVEDVMRERSGRIFRARRPMHERDGTERGLASRSAGEREARPVAQRYAPRGRQLHEQVVRVLVIGNLKTPVGLPLLEDLRVPRIARRHRFGRQHAGQGQRAAADAPGGHAHHPVLGHEFGVAPQAALSVERAEDDAVEAEAPADSSPDQRAKTMTPAAEPRSCRGRRRPRGCCAAAVLARQTRIVSARMRGDVGSTAAGYFLAAVRSARAITSASTV